MEGTKEFAVAVAALVPLDPSRYDEACATARAVAVQLNGNARKVAPALASPGAAPAPRKTKGKRIRRGLKELMQDPKWVYEQEKAGKPVPPGSVPAWQPGPPFGRQPKVAASSEAPAPAPETPAEAPPPPAAPPTEGKKGNSKKGNSKKGKKSGSKKS